jgi:hypothetical protein
MDRHEELSCTRPWLDVLVYRPPHKTCLQWELHTLSIILTTATSFLSDILDRIQFRRGIKVFVKVASFNIVNKRNSLPTKQCFCESGSVYPLRVKTFMSLVTSETTEMSRSRHRMGGLETLAFYHGGRYDVKVTLMTWGGPPCGSMTVFHRLKYSLSSAVLCRACWAENRVSRWDVNDLTILREQICEQRIRSNQIS